MKPTTPTDHPGAALQPREDAQLAVREEPSIAHMLQAFIDKGITPDNVAAFGQLVTLHERMEDRHAEKRFNADFAELQKQLPVIVASTIIPNRGKYEKFEDVMRVVQEPLAANGFSVSFTQDWKENRVTETCHLRHVAGVTKTNSFTVRVGKGDSETQADCKASTTAKRNALLNALNIVIRQDVLDEEHDAAIEGAPVTWEQAEYLRQRVKETKSNEASFLQFAGATSYEEIAASKYDRLIAALAKKDRP